MSHELISGIIYTELSEELGPNPKYWIPSDLNESTRMLISIKTLTLLTGEEEYTPKELVIIPFPSLSFKGLVKYIHWKDIRRRGGLGRSALTLLFNDIDDIIFYKYKKNLEKLFSAFAKKLIEFEASNVKEEDFNRELWKFQSILIKTFEDYRKNELSTKEIDSFPERGDKKLEEYDYRFKVILCGDPEVGKTSLVLRFTDKAFSRTYLPTIGVNVNQKNIRVRDYIVQLFLWDIAGQQKFSKMRSHFYKGAEGIIMVFDLTRFKTFNNCYNWYKDVKQNLKKESVTTGFIFGNKLDLIASREIKENVGEQLASELNLKYIETSALTGENVDDSFYKIAETILKSKLEQI